MGFPAQKALSPLPFQEYFSSRNVNLWLSEPGGCPDIPLVVFGKGLLVTSSKALDPNRSLSPACDTR